MSWSDPSIFKSVSGRWNTIADTAGEEDYHPLDNVGQSASDHEKRVGRMRMGIRTKADALIEGEERFKVVFQTGDTVRECWVTIVDDDPGVEDVNVVSRPANGEAYGVGERIGIDVAFNGPVRVVGDAVLTIRIKHSTDSKADHQLRYLPYSSGSGTDTLRFSYTVLFGDNADRGFHVEPISDTGLGEGAMKSADPDHLDVYAHHEFLGGTFEKVGWFLLDHEIATGRPSISDVEIVSSPADGAAYRLGETVVFDLTFNGDVTVAGAPKLRLRVNNPEVDGRSAQGDRRTGHLHAVPQQRLPDRGHHRHRRRLQQTRPRGGRTRPHPRHSQRRRSSPGLHGPLRPLLGQQRLRYPQLLLYRAGGRRGRQRHHHRLLVPQWHGRGRHQIPVRRSRRGRLPRL